MSDVKASSFLKKEISLQRKPKVRSAESAPPASPMLDELERIKALVTAATQPEQKADTSAPEPVAEAVALPAAPETSEAPAAPEPAAARDLGNETDAQALTTPFWKKELSLTRKAKKAKEPKPVKEPKQPEGAKEPKPKRLKRRRAKDEQPQQHEVDATVQRAGAVQNESQQAAEENPKPAKTKRKRDLRLRKPSVARPRKRGKHGETPKRLVGLKVGASQIAAARVANNGSAELLQVARTTLDPGVVVGGELREPEKLADALRDFFKKNNLPRTGVRLGIANNRIGVRTFEIVGVEDPKQLDNAIRFRAQDALPIAIEDAVLDYRILSETVGRDGQTVKNILLVVAHREFVDRYVGACRKAGLELVGIDLEAFALLRSLNAPGDTESDAAAVVVSVGHDRSTFAVSNGRICQFTRVLEWGGSSLDTALARALEIPQDAAEALKRTLDLDASAPPPGLSEDQLATAKDAVRRQIQSFARELVSSLHFYQNQPHSLSIGEIVLTGGTAQLPGLAQELHHLIGVNVRVGDPLHRVRVAKKALDDAEPQLGSLAVAIGLGIED